MAEVAWANRSNSGLFFSAVIIWAIHHWRFRSNASNFRRLLRCWAEYVVVRNATRLLVLFLSLDQGYNLLSHKCLLDESHCPKVIIVTSHIFFHEWVLRKVISFLSPLLDQSIPVIVQAKASLVADDP